MHGPQLAMKRSQSECLVLNPRICSPAPVYNKKASRIGVNVARELFDVPATIQEFEFEVEESSMPNLFKAKSCIFRTGTDSFNEWSSESGFSGTVIPGESESPTRASSKNPLSQDSLFEEISMELPCRTSNPIVHDTKFRRNNQKPCGFPFYSLQVNGINTSNL